MKLKIINLHILRYLPTCWLYILEHHTIDNQRCTHIASNNRINADLINDINDNIYVDLNYS